MRYLSLLLATPRLGVYPSPSSSSPSLSLQVTASANPCPTTTTTTATTTTTITIASPAAPSSEGGKNMASRQELGGVDKTMTPVPSLAAKQRRDLLRVPSGGAAYLALRALASEFPRAHIPPPPPLLSSTLSQPGQLTVPPAQLSTSALLPA
ncbi:hypothetical protein E2C01_046471 [Portunus trituberculatus]|uniref:Uncharacterized protein n=1 Tax=Portunus trituberculatus TaxID=210409 RepID=A0A5B7G4V4_PORTR|nr:hypothetical protein [Portunus trituberculatus]